MLDTSLFSFAFCELFNIPFSPVNLEIVNPANIKSIIIVITRAINVIPLFFFVLLIFYS